MLNNKIGPGINMNPKNGDIKENKNSTNSNEKSNPSNDKKKKKKWSKKKKILIIIVVIFAILLISVGYFGFMASREIVRDVSVKNPDGETGTAFVVIRPGVCSFQDDVTGSFIKGLVKSDWRVESTSSHKNTPTNLSKYDMFMFGSPTYGSKPHQSLLDYLKRVDLDGKPVILLVTAGGDGKEALDILKEAVVKANGTVIAELELLTGENSGGEAETEAYDLGKSYIEIPE